MMASVNSTTFIKRPPCMTETGQKFLYTKKLLSGRIFLGCYQERRYVAALNEYRDVVTVHSDETDLRSDIDKLRKKWMDAKNIKWLGITGPDSVDLPKMYCFWAKLTNLAFGHYWFQIKRVHLKEAEISVNLRCIRKSQAIQPAFVTSSTEKIIAGNKNEKPEPISTINSAKLKEATEDLKAHLTLKNFLHALKVAFGLTIAVVLGTITFIRHLGEYILKLIRELSILVQACTPIIIQVIDFCSKIVGGFYILIAGLFGRNVYHPIVQSQGQSNLHDLNASQPPPINWRERNRVLRKELLSGKLKSGW